MTTVPRGAPGCTCGTPPFAPPEASDDCPFHAKAESVRTLFDYHLAKLYCQEAGRSVELALRKLQAAQALFERDPDQPSVSQVAARNLGDAASGLKVAAVTILEVGRI